MKIPLPPSPLTLVLMGGFASRWVSPALERCQPQLLLPKGLLPPQAVGGCIPPAPVCTLCHQLPPKCYFNQQQQPGLCQAPGWELCPSGKRNGTRAGGL